MKKKKNEPDPQDDWPSILILRRTLIKAVSPEEAEAVLRNLRSREEEPCTPTSNKP